MLRRPSTSLRAAPRGRIRHLPPTPSSEAATPPPPSPAPEPPAEPPPRRPLSWAARLRWTGGILVVVGALVWLLWSVFSMLLASAALAYLLDPLVDRFERRGRSREFGIGAIFTVGVTLLVLVPLVIIPSVANQIAVMSGNVGLYAQQAAAFVEPYRLWAEQQTGLPLPLDILQLGQEIPGYLKHLSPDTQASLKSFLGHTLTSGMGLVMTIFNLALLPIFTFYLLRDWDRLIAWCADHVPTRYRPVTFRIARDIDERMSSFVRGQITICFLLGILYSIGLWAVARIDLPILVGMTAGALFIVPYLGTIFGIVLGTVLALMKYGLSWHVLAVWGVFGAAQALEGTVLTPKIVGDKVGLHPLVVMIALIAGGNLLGIWGMLLAIPVTAALSVLLRTLVTHYQDSAFYRET